MKKVVLSLMFTLTCWAYESITNQQLVTLSKTSTIIDIRTPSEWRETGVIKGSQLITFFNDDGSYDARGFLLELQKRKIDTQGVIIICRSGNRSVPVSDFLTRQGFKEVYNVKHGILGWLSEGRKIERLK